MIKYILILFFFSLTLAQHDFFNIEHKAPFKLKMENSFIIDTLLLANPDSQAICYGGMWLG